MLSSLVTSSTWSLILKGETDLVASRLIVPVRARRPALSLRRMLHTPSKVRITRRELPAALLAGGMAGATVFLRRTTAGRRSVDADTHAASPVMAEATRVAPSVDHSPAVDQKDHSCLPPLPATVRNQIGDFDRGRYANHRELDGQAFYIPSLIGQPEDRSVFNQLMDELDFRSCWLNTGMKFARDICLGDEEILARSPTYRAIVERVANQFGVTPVRTLVNLYRDGDDWCNLHRDQYHQGGYPIDLTIGATFGDRRRLIFVESNNENHRITVPQNNGDVFAFSDHINNTWRHMIPREGPECGPRISVIVWCTHRSEANSGLDVSLNRLGRFPHMLYYNPKGEGSEAHERRSPKGAYRKGYHHS